MSEINITRLFREESSFVPFDISNNVATLGDDAGKLTWGAAVECAEDESLLNTEDLRDEFRDYVHGFGAWGTIRHGILRTQSRSSRRGLGSRIRSSSLMSSVMTPARRRAFG